MRDAVFADRTKTILLGILFMLPAALAAAAVPAGEPAFILGCRHDARDEILTIICRRVETEAVDVARAAGYSLQVSRNSSANKSLGNGSRSLDISLTATRPDSQFADKRIDAALVGRFSVQQAPPWEVELAAEGAPRDLVHPVADALLGRIEAFLATAAPE